MDPGISLQKKYLSNDTDHEALIPAWVLSDRIYVSRNHHVFRIGSHKADLLQLMIRADYPKASTFFTTICYIYSLVRIHDIRRTYALICLFIRWLRVPEKAIFEILWNTSPVPVNLAPILLWRNILWSLLLLLLSPLMASGSEANYLISFTFWRVVRWSLSGAGAEGDRTRKSQTQPYLADMRSRDTASLLFACRCMGLTSFFWWDTKPCQNPQLTNCGHNAIIKKYGHYFPDYEYQKLENGYIRLLSLSREHSNGIPRCSLVTISFDEAIQASYEAVSYTWGKDGRDSSILVGCSQLRVTKSVYSIVSSMTPLRGTCLLWVDFICINQKDNAEKSSQVRMMREIYSRAAQVLVFLSSGRMDPQSCTMAKQHLEMLAAQSRRGERNFSNFYGEINEFSQSVTRSPGWTELGKLLNHPYWSRVWIIQEVAVAKTLKVIYGQVEMQWEDLVVYAMSSADLGTANVVDTNLDISLASLQEICVSVAGVADICRVHSMRADFQGDRKRTLADLLLASSPHLATNKLDHVYALQGLVSFDIPKNLLPNYGEVELTELFIHTATHMLSGPNPLWILSAAGLGYINGVRAHERLPSWVPDWSQRHKKTQLILPNEDALLRLKVPMTLLRGFLPCVVPKGSKHVLRVWSYQIDTISSICAFPMPPAQTYTNMKSMTSPMDLIPDYVRRYLRFQELIRHQPPDPYCTGGTRRNALFSLLTNTSLANTGSTMEDFDAWEKSMALNFQLLQVLQPSVYHELETLFPTESKHLKAFDLAEFDMSEMWKLSGVMGGANRFMSDLATNCIGRSFGITEKGYMAIIPPHCVPGDQIFYLVPGVPRFVLREVDQNHSSEAGNCINEYFLVGDCSIKCPGGRPLEDLRSIDII